MVDMLVQCAGQNDTAANVANSANVVVAYVVIMSLETAWNARLAFLYQRVPNVRTLLH